jgi:predicted aspartyl protease
MKARSAFASLAICLPCVLAAGASSAHVARLDMPQGIPLAQVRINGQGPFAFVIDTGTSSEAIISPRLVKRLGLAAEGRRSITDLGGHDRRAVDAVELDSLLLAGTEFRSVHAAVADLPDGDSVLDGILGFGLFRGAILTLDYPRHRLILEDGSLAGSRDPNVLPMRMPYGIPLVDISIAGTKVQAGVDSGAVGLSIPSALAARLRLASGVEAVAFGRTEVSGFELRGALLDGNVNLAGYRFEGPWLELNPVFAIANLGSAAMRDFAVTFDQRSRLVRFTSASSVHRLVKPRNPASFLQIDELVGTVYTSQTF